MAEKYQNEMHFDFSGAVNQSVSRLLMADNEVNAVENGELTKIGSIFKVRGYSQRGADVNTGYPILGMINAYRNSDGVRKQIVIADGASNSDAYTFNPVNGLWTPHHLSLTTGSKAEFQSFLGGFFMVNFTDATRWNDLTAWYTNTNVTDAAKAKYIQLYLSRLYLGYVVSGGGTFSSRVTYSDLPTGGPLTLTWNDTLNYFDVDPDDGDFITGLKENANRLLIFKQNSLFRYDTNTLYKVPACPGTIAHESIRNIQGHTLYLHYTGIWDYDGSASTLISRKIQEIIDGISTRAIGEACGLVRGDHYYLYLGDIYNSKTGLTINNCLIDYDIAKKAITWRSIKDTPTKWMTYPDDTASVTYNDASLTYNDSNTTFDSIQSTEEKIYFGTDQGQVFQFDIGRQYDGTDISFSVETKDYYLGYPSFFKLMQKVVVFNDFAGKGITVQAKLDDKDWITLGRVNRTASELVFPAGSRCQRVKFRILESSGGDRFAFEGLDIYFTAEGLIE